MSRRSSRLKYKDYDDYDYSDGFVVEEDTDESLTDNEDVKEVEKISKHLQDNMPSVKTILNSSISFEDKAHLVQMYEIFKNTPALTIEWLNIKNNIQLKIKECENKYKFYKNKDERHVKKEMKRLEVMYDNAPLEYLIVNLDTSDGIKSKIVNKYRRSVNMIDSDEEKYKLEEQIRWSIKLPYNRSHNFNIGNNFLKQVKDRLDSEMYGMESVKEQILLFLNLKLRNPNVKGCNLGLSGPPGVGKTMIVSCLSKILGIPFQKIFMGSATDVNYIKGSSKVWVGTGPGIIARKMCELSVNNGILFFDEINRVYGNPNIETALLQIMDPVQNHEFDDVFLEDIPIDLSNVWFMSSMNKLPTNKALLNRMYIINVPGYTKNEQVSILQNFILPTILKEFNLSNNDITISKDVALYAINRLPQDEGMRTIKSAMQNIIKKICFLKYNKKIKMSFTTALKFPLSLNKKHVDSFL